MHSQSFRYGPVLLTLLGIAPVQAGRFGTLTPRFRPTLRPAARTLPNTRARGPSTRAASTSVGRRHAATKRPVKREGTGTARQTRTVEEAVGHRGGRPSSPPRVVGAARHGNYAQADLARVWDSAATRRPSLQFQKDAVVAGYPIPPRARGLADLPPQLRELLGKVDKTKYTDAYIRQRRGDHVMVQFKKDGTPDLYMSRGSRTTYDLVEEAGPAGDAARRRAAEIGIDPGSLQMLRKRELTEMRPASELGMPLHRERTIAAPWGGTQTKPAGADAYVVKNGDEFYLVQRDPATGLPIGYRTPAPVPTPAKAQDAGEGGLASIFGL